MKKYITTSILAALVATMTTVMAQEYPEEYLGLPGDNLNLYAVMKLFQESQTIEGFERSLNDENSRINNLDLNNDSQVDYIDVIDYVDGEVHSIVLRALLGPNDSQDVAVFTVQKFRDGSVQMQLVGDEALYGKNYIIEPYYDENTGETPNPGYAGRTTNRVNVTIVRTTPFEIAAWPLIRFIYMPDYVIWRSSWYWGYYPEYWHPWRPFYWHYYYGYHHNWYHQYYAHYRHWNDYRYPRYNDFYYHGVRAYSPHVSDRIREGSYRNTYSHPEQRKEGEALYSKTYQDHNSSRSDNTAADNRRGNAASQSNRERTNAVNRSNATRQSENSTGTRSGNERSKDQKAEVSRRQSETVSERNAARSVERQNAETSRRSSSSVSAKPASRTDQGQKNESTRSSRSNIKSAASSTSGKSKENKAGSSSKKNNSSEKSDNNKDTRRR